MKKLPLGIQSFKEIITENYVYADKTEYIYNLINNAKYYFLSRPRRFGKSLLIDTIHEVFNGDKELFKGLSIYDSDYEFKTHPVIRLDMSGIANETPEILKNSLYIELKKRANNEGFSFDYETPSDIFKNFIEYLHNKYNQRVVVLIDEYDKPILDHILSIETAEANRQVLKGFYGILKSMDAHLRFTLITGVTKFTKTSIFSELNNLYDITMVRDYANICGVETCDLNKYFNEHIEKLASLDRFDTSDSIREEILAWYDGYSWDGITRVINPFSLLSFFSRKDFSSFWYASGTPKFLMDLRKKRPTGYTDFRNLTIGEWSLDSFDIKNMSAAPLLFQTGYLTVEKVLPGQRPPAYLLKIPNYEVRIAFSLNILAEFTEAEATSTESAYRDINESLETGDLQKMLETFRALFASIPYQLHIKSEYYYHSIFYAIMNLFGFDIDAEVSVSGGRMDATLETDDKIYVMEFKYKDCPPDASEETKRQLFDEELESGAAQIKNKGYAKKYESSGKKIYQTVFAFLGRDNIEMKVIN
jgi:hypothetical protein